MAGPGIELLVVAGEPLWPSAGGGEPGRAAGLVGALAGRLAVRVVAPVDGPPPGGVVVGVDPLPDEEPAGRLVAALSPLSRLGRAQLGPRRSQALLRAVADHRPRAILYVHGYLAAAAPSIDRPVFVDFPVLSVRRSEGSSAFESLKARWWEPVEARRAVAVSATTSDDVALLSSWGARAMPVPDGPMSPSEWATACAALADAIARTARTSATT